MPGLLPPFMRKEPLTWLYLFLARAVRQGNSKENLHGYVIPATLVTCAITGMLILIAWLNELEILFWLIGGAGAFLFVIVDIAAITFSIIITQSQAVNWDLLRLTPVQPRFFIESEWQVSQTQTWRILVVMQAIRLTIVCVSVPFGFALLGLIIMFTAGAGLIWIVSWLFLILSEPVWRLQAMTAIGIFAGVRSDNVMMRWLMGLGMMFVVWLAQGAIALVPMGVMWTGDDDTIFIGLTFIFPVMTFAIRFAQLHIRDWCLNGAVRHFEQVR